MKTKFTFYSTLMFVVLFFNTANATIHTVDVASYSFTPSTLSIKSGDTVKWVWVSGSHTTTSVTIPAGATSWSHPMNSSSQIFEIQLTVAGEYDYHCAIHPTMMHGVINVSAGSGLTSYNSTSNFMHLYPNPFITILSMSFTLKESGTVKISIYDITGKIVRMLANSNYEKGDHVICWDGKNENGENVNHGIYYYLIETKGQSKASGKIIYGS